MSQIGKAAILHAMSRRRNEFRSVELVAKAILAILVFISLAVGGILHFSQILTGLVELLLILAVVTGLGWLGITIGIRIFRNRSAASTVPRTPAPNLVPGAKGPLSTWVWPDDKGTTLRLPEGEPVVVSRSVREMVPPKPDAVKSWTEDKILQKIHELDWYQFEKFNAALLKAEGWDTTHFRNEHGDGGKDIVAKKNGQTLYVQCKALSEPVREKVVRELVGSLSIAQIASGAIHAAGPFSKSAQALAATVGVWLLDDHALAARARKSMPDDQLQIVLSELPHLCPNCDSEMVFKTGDFDPFWGCPRYPRCRGKINCRNVAGSRRAVRLTCR
jgi:hypothetical protein